METLESSNLKAEIVSLRSVESVPSPDDIPSADAIPSGASLLISPHPKAPLFDRSDALLILQQAMGEANSDNFQLNNEICSIFRQAGFVNLYFLIKYIWGVDGEYDRLTDELHLPVCNFVQSVVTTPGERGILIMPRGHAKSKCATEGGSGFVLLRDPSKCIKILNATEPRADQFKEQVRAAMQGDFFRLLYPEYSVSKIGPVIVLVNGKRLRYRREDSLASGGIMGSPEGEHFDGLMGDDIYGGKLINAMRQSGADMAKTKQKWATNSIALLNSPARSFIMMAGTRWGTDDGYQEQLDDMKENCGSEVPGGFQPKPDGQWKVYYRDVIEHEQPIFPGEFPMETLTKMANSEDSDMRWTWMVQYRNNPYAAGVAEFTDARLKKFRLERSEKHGWMARVFEEGEERLYQLSKGHTLCATDPAASEKYMSAKTSRTALINLTRMSNEKKFIFGVHADYIAVSKLYDWIFDNAARYHELLSKTVLETQGAFKILGPLIRTEQHKREVERLKRRERFYSPKLTPVNRTLSDKVAVIRSVLGPELDASNIYVEESVYHIVGDEVKGFPTASRKDVLDAICLAILGSYRPQSEDELLEEEQSENDFARRRAGITGY